jgi:hypothetical protein
MALRTIVVGVVLVSLLQPTQAQKQANVATGDLTFLQPWFNPSEDDRHTLAQRGAVVRSLPASHQQISVIAACAVKISPEAFLAQVRKLGYVKRDRLIAGRFGEPPALDDLAPLSLEQGDIDRLRQCQPGDCALNLADEEMAELQQALAQHPGASVDVQNAYRRVVFERVRRYQSGGLAALPAYHDRSALVQPAAVFSEILQQTPYLKQHIPALLEYLKRYPSIQTPGAASFLHWSKVIMNNKPVVLVAHLTTFRPDPGPGVPTVLLAAKQVYASRYMNGELALWMLFAGDDDRSPNYLVYVHRSHLDELGGTMTAVKRSVIESRIKQETGGALTSLRDQLEGGR